jgi:hypothetical protein
MPIFLCMILNYVNGIIVLKVMIKDKIRIKRITKMSKQKLVFTLWNKMSFINFPKIRSRWLCLFSKAFVVMSFILTTVVYLFKQIKQMNLDWYWKIRPPRSVNWFQITSNYITLLSNRAVQQSTSFRKKVYKLTLDYALVKPPCVMTGIPQEIFCFISTNIFSLLRIAWFPDSERLLCVHCWDENKL